MRVSLFPVIALVKILAIKSDLLCGLIEKIGWPFKWFDIQPHDEGMGSVEG